jgi:hypothetical protein
LPTTYNDKDRRCVAVDAVGRGDAGRSQVATGPGLVAACASNTASASHTGGIARRAMAAANLQNRIQRIVFHDDMAR